MDYGYSVLMGIFAGIILLYAGLMALTKDYRILPFRSRQSVKPKNEKKYMIQLSKMMALTAFSPALASIAGLRNVFAGMATLIGTCILFIWLGTKFMKNTE